jgi:hypothetical protein
MRPSDLSGGGLSDGGVFWIGILLRIVPLVLPIDPVLTQR